MNKFPLLLVLSICMACGSKATVNTDLVQNSTLHIETLTDDSDLAVVLKNTPYWDEYSPSLSVSIEDERILRFKNIPLQSVTFELLDNGLLGTVEIKVQKESITIAKSKIAIKKEENEDAEENANEDGDKEDSDKEDSDKEIKVNKYAWQLYETLTTLYGVPEKTYNDNLIWTNDTQTYRLSMDEDTYGAPFQIYFNNSYRGY